MSITASAEVLKRIANDPYQPHLRKRIRQIFRLAAMALLVVAGRVNAEVSRLGPNIFEAGIPSRRYLTFLAISSLLGAPAFAQTPEVLLPGDEADIVRRVHAGGTVRLGAGLFHFDAGWNLAEDFELIGDGREATVLRFRQPASPEGAAIEWRGQGRFRLAHLALDYEDGVTPGGLIRAEAGTVELVDIIVRGDAETEANADLRSRNGVVLGGSAGGFIVDSTLQWHRGSGLLLTDRARAVVERSMILDNGQTGVAAVDDSVLTVETSTIAGNPLGVYAGGNAYYTLIDTTLHNDKSGVESNEAAAGVLLDSRVHEHGSTAIVGNDQSWTTVLSSEVSLNQSGVGSYGATGFARFTVIDSEFAANRFQGLSTGVSTSLVVIDSVVRDSGSSGIAVGSSAMGSVIGTTMEGNGRSGIECWYSLGALVDNIMVGNTEYGFTRADESRCRDHGSYYELNGLGDAKVYETP